jgi:hypothetical protein
VQKKNKKASILIWAIFLSLMISLSFISISTKITESLKNNNTNNKNIKENNDMREIILNSEKAIEII